MPSPTKRRYTLRELRDAVPGSRAGEPLTVRKAADLARISPGHLSNVENGNFTASPRLLYRLAGAYGVTIETVHDAYQETLRRMRPPTATSQAGTIQTTTRPKPKK